MLYQFASNASARLHVMWIMALKRIKENTVLCSINPLPKLPVIAIIPYTHKYKILAPGCCFFAIRQKQQIENMLPCSHVSIIYSCNVTSCAF